METGVSLNNRPKEAENMRGSSFPRYRASFYLSEAYFLKKMFFFTNEASNTKYFYYSLGNLLNASKSFSSNSTS